MTETILLAALVGVVIPAVTAAATREQASDRTKALVTGLLSAVGGILTRAVISPPSTAHEWGQLGIGVLVCWAAAITSYLAAWKPTGASKAIAHRTRNIGDR